MTSFTILNQGTARREANGDWIATSTAVLLRDSGRTILVDPGQDERALLAALYEEIESSRTIDLIYLTHHHLDHIVLMRLFPWTEVMMGDMLVSGDRCIEVSERIPRTSIRFLPTPGHSAEHFSLLFNAEKEGRVAVAGDVFWWQDHEEQRTDRASLLAQEDPTAVDPGTLRLSRELILGEADYIIPGHGSPFFIRND